MNTFPKSLEEAVAQAKKATKSAIADGYTRIQIELIIPEIALQAQALAREFASIFSESGSGLKVIFPDTGAAALARRDWGDVPFQVTDLGGRFTPIDTKITEDDQVFLLVSPSSVEVNQVEKLCNLAGDRPVVLLIPQLEDISIVGIGYAARQMRERFINTLYSCYYLRPLEEAAVFRCHPSAWQIWLEKEEDYEFATEVSSKPIGEDLDRLLLKLTQGEQDDSKTPQSNKRGIFSNLQRFLKALSQ
jgi:hypothetical protein